MPRTPDSNGRIFKVTEYDLLNTSIVTNNYYACTDSRKMYKDTNSRSRELLNVTMIDTEVDRLYNIRPKDGVQYYVWETNELWVYNAGWILRIGEIRSRSSGYYYRENKIRSTDIANDSHVIDNNGLLRDGSIVVRDLNRVIKGRVYIDETNNNLVISSFLGGGIRILPNGSMGDMGSLVINPNTVTKYSNIVTGDIIDLVDYYKLSDEDKLNYEEVVITLNDGYALFHGQLTTTDDLYVSTDKYNVSGDFDSHRYKLFHEGDLKDSSSALKQYIDNAISDVINNLK